MRSMSEGDRMRAFGAAMDWRGGTVSVEVAAQRRAGFFDGWELLELRTPRDDYGRTLVWRHRCGVMWNAGGETIAPPRCCAVCSYVDGEFEDRPTPIVTERHLRIAEAAAAAATIDKHLAERIARSRDGKLA